MLDPRRALAPARILMSLAFALLLSSFFIRALIRPWPETLRPFDATRVIGGYRETGQRISGVISQPGGHGSPSEAPPLAVLLGSSATKYDVDARILDGERPCRWLNLGTNAANVEDCLSLAQLLYSSGLKIDTVVLGLHPEMVARTEVFLADATTLDLAGWRQRLAIDGWRGALTEIDLLLAVVKGSLFPCTRRTCYRVREGAEMIRTSLLLRLGMGLKSIYRPTPDPWAVPGVTGTEAHRTAKQKEDYIALLRREHGFYRTEAYRPGGSKLRDLDELINLIEGHGAELFVLIVPAQTRVPRAAPGGGQGGARSRVNATFRIEWPRARSARESPRRSVLRRCPPRQARPRGRLSTSRRFHPLGETRCGVEPGGCAAARLDDHAGLRSRRALKMDGGADSSRRPPGQVRGRARLGRSVVFVVGWRDRDVPKDQLTDWKPNVRLLPIDERRVEPNQSSFPRCFQ